MTVLCAIKDPKLERVIITSDTGAKNGQLAITCGPKWITHERWALGLSGDWRATCIAEAHKEDLFKALTVPWDFVEAWHKLLKDHDFDLKPAEGSATPNSDQNCILVNHESIWSIAGDFSCIEVSAPFFAEGCGEHFALGAAKALEGLALEPDEIINRATNAAIEMSVYCFAPIWIGQVK